MTTTVKVSELDPPLGLRAKVKQVGPGLLAAATGVGAGDLVATMIAVPSTALRSSGLRCSARS